MKLDPKEEISYRVRIAERFLKEASDAYRRRDYRLVVASSQLSVENAAKVVIAYLELRAGATTPQTSYLSY